ncbi:uncharacterized protein HME9302_01025 [Alteripontixanthobacter maritimus]|uniref:Porin P n=1 Tax=Alteripontixanthobacter maritimus TaxID=2161824 RepID=A0A369Q5X3_9SPHN|nr:porin [Alteripontixanthobacter maritimus]RDC59830.1 uncharacterized protein HME9302_01025 [Alteripontixanthobacter maritimus]
MSRISLYRTAALGAVCLWATPAFAQDAGDAAIQQELAEMRAQMQAMAQRIDVLQAELASTEAELVAKDEANEAAITAAGVEIASAKTANEGGVGTVSAWKGAPVISGPGGVTFKPRGRLQYDAGSISAPDSTGVDDGFGNEARRIRVGVQGDLTGGFGYKVEVDVTDGAELTDAIITYDTDNFGVTVGQHNNFQGLEELTSSLSISFLERAAFTDAFGFQRKVGVSGEVKTGDLLLQGGVFTDNITDLPNKQVGADARVVLMPKFGEAQLHLGASVHYTDFDEANSSVRYRQRPAKHFTSTRFLNTGTFEGTNATGYGLEAAAIAGPFHVTGEAFWQNVDRPDLNNDPGFFGGYAEVGYFLTGGDSRGYKSGKFDRIKPANPVGDGGIGAIQLNLRYDYLDLNDAGIVGGKQNGYLASMIWSPTAYTRFMIDYASLAYDDAVIPAANGDRDYTVNTLGLRAQVDF